jgi:hypothetical protein
VGKSCWRAGHAELVSVSKQTCRIDPEINSG